MSYVDIRFEFDVEEEDGHTYLELKRLRWLGEEMPVDGMEGFLEGLVQSDEYSIELPAAVVEVLGGQEVVEL